MTYENFIAQELERKEIVVDIHETQRRIGNGLTSSEHLDSFDMEQLKRFQCEVNLEYWEMFKKENPEVVVSA